MMSDTTGQRNKAVSLSRCIAGEEISSKLKVHHEGLGLELGLSKDDTLCATGGCAGGCYGRQLSVA